MKARELVHDALDWLAEAEGHRIANIEASADPLGSIVGISRDLAKIEEARKKIRVEQELKLAKKTTQLSVLDILDAQRVERRKKIVGKTSKFEGLHGPEFKVSMRLLLLI